MKIFALYIFTYFFAMQSTAQLLKKMLKENASPLLNHVLENPDSFRYQIIYTQIDRDQNNKPHFKTHSIRNKPNEYFYPASTLKMPLSILSLEKLNKLAITGLDAGSVMYTDSANSSQKKYAIDKTSQSGLPSIDNYIKRIFIVSDNDAPNRLYEFLGQNHINKRLQALAFNNTRVTRKYGSVTAEENTLTNPIRFFDAATGKVLYDQSSLKSQYAFSFPKSVLLGKGYVGNDGALVNEPKDFTENSAISLQNLTDILKRTLFPENFSKENRFDLREEDYKKLYTYMSEYPAESRYPVFDSTQYFQTYGKFFFSKSEEAEIPDNIRVFNKIGMAYGFLTDVSYVVDFEHGIEYILSAVIYVNKNGIFNDDKYEYKTVGFPFLTELNDIVMKHELARKRKYHSNLSKFKLVYDK